MPVIQRTAAQRHRVHFQKARWFSAHSVRIGIWWRKSVPGRVVARRRCSIRAGISSRSSVARLAANNAWRTSAFRR